MIDINVEFQDIKRIADQLTILNDKMDLLIDILKPPQAEIIRFYCLVDGKTRKVTNMFLKVNQSLPMSIKITDKFGNAAVVDGVPGWAMTDPSLGALEIAEDGMSAMLKPSGPVGVCKVQVTCDADMGEGVKPILGELEVEFLAGEAEVVAISAGEPV